ncbi:MAG: family 78 glycoside hydrolase catalytic domain [Planctomycetaceae bacterium]|nr:glycoside hydrolase family 78 protein [Planctomycetaceae bacterium]
MNVSQLTCEYSIDPLGLDMPAPRLSWMIQSDARGAVQAAYQVLVASSADLLAADQGDKWDSGRVASDQSINLPYGGAALASGEKCWWKVRVWDPTNAQAGAWSQPATFEMGLLTARDWKGKWIAAAKSVSAPLLRKSFTLSAAPARGRVYICGLGCHELYVNGRRVSDRMMDPAPTWYDNILPVENAGSRVLYVTHDVTDLLAAGENVIGVLLGHGWYSSDDGKPSGRTPFSERPVLLLQANIELADGQSVSIASDTSWKANPSPITANDLCAGEHYDARLEQDGWSAAGFDDAKWVAAVAAKAPSGKLVAMPLEPCRITNRLTPTRVLKSGDNAYIFDMGQYVSGWTELRVQGPAGTVVTLEHAGRVNYDTGKLDTRNQMAWHPSPQTDSYTLRGSGEVETWHPRFTIHGFRYVEVTGWPGVPTCDDLTGCAVNNDIEPAGQFECSDDMVNRVHHNVWWTFHGSFQGIPQDASDRAERVAWLGDPGFVAEDYMVNFRDVRFWSKWLDDIADAQKPDGQVPYIAPPNWGENSWRDWPCWECSYSLFTWFVYQYNNDVRVLEKHYEGLRKQVEHFRALAKANILADVLGDHMEPRDDGTSSFCPLRTPAALTATAYYFRCAQIVAEAARILGNREDAKAYSRLAETIKDAFNREFFNFENNQYATNSQTANALALHLDLVPGGREKDVLANLVADIKGRGNRLSTGIIGTDALEQSLPKHGSADVMLLLAQQTAFPSWGYGVVNGMTTICEDFECSTYHSLSMKMLGSVEKFLHKDVAGLSPAAPGWKRIEIAPKVCEHLAWAKGSYRTAYGPACVEWHKDEDAGEGQPTLKLAVTIPANTTATVTVPTLDLRKFQIAERGRTLWTGRTFAPGADGIAAGRIGESDVTFDVESGTYVFELSRTN